MIDSMKFGEESELFGNEKDDSFREALVRFTRLSEEKKCIRPWRRKRRIFCIFSPKTIPFQMEIKGSPLRFFCIFWIETRHFSRTGKEDR